MLHAELKNGSLEEALTLADNFLLMPPKKA